MPGPESPVSVLITCEHARNEVPPRWQPLFAGHEALLDSHRGWDPGSLDLARSLSTALSAPLLAGRVTRLLIDLNRSAGHPARFSELTRQLAPADRRRIEAEYWQPHWQAFGDFLAASAAPVVHLACHSFVPVLEGVERRADIGLLYDPRRPSERAFAAELRAAIGRCLPGLRVRMNQPYRGTANGIGQQHRRRYDGRRLITLEIEINQALVAARAWSARVEALSGAVREVLNKLGGDVRGWPFGTPSG
ncbi:N-formylglutamate amidohydrolase [Wenzhouxiangella sp. XN201]|uniref:N-formylglutamate amidohydrolase n=1 Tax=Wenzhouxiangella sp. XN201 TaxID=2710755 RepID=UPI0013CB1569|nr:N-formylglutamate amidohydrolase [Wenzhouxiangella sp. XN201]NEZ04062.1 N-formylglutamate amidohydrolase [Wenzhouxiangella sp. XN201]